MEIILHMTQVNCVVVFICETLFNILNEFVTGKTI